jgi:hypothetical protein
MGKYTTAVYRQRPCKHVPAATITQATVDVLLGYNNGNGIFYVVRAEML